ncbi:N(G),N(G)-dimethylarginine dimethylaminohydrolase [Microbacterium lemovicicum]|uniref:N(G),N(G)-dimethylarginine dimethylaminohydrolase n=1 Tax=Microbacterium lemovicicum TaxID=1072463 RepID=A0A3Q9J3S0_9MICO|nr:dimethylargininase [Microbacterium lemovicicum]AZS37220.1 N(G),N(G)-dimethylarginine dimethylaminohydrolase [Microbacterium lemovicicum]
MPRVLVRRPSPRLADGELTHLDRVAVDPDLAARQWAGYVDVFRSRGWEVLEVDPADDQPDGVFVEDAIIVFGDLALLCRAGAESRRGEAVTVRVAAAAAGLPLSTITAPGTLDGGDVLKVGRTVFVGASSRTNADGIAQLRAVVEPAGWEVVEIPVSRVLHLKSGVTALPDGTVIGFAPLVDDPALFPEFLAVPEEHGTAVVVLDERTVLMSSDAPRTRDLLHDRGLEVVTVDVSEFEKLEGCVTCLSVRLRE